MFSLPYCLEYMLLSPLIVWATLLWVSAYCLTSLLLIYYRPSGGQFRIAYIVSHCSFALVVTRRDSVVYMFVCVCISRLLLFSNSFSSLSHFISMSHRLVLRAWTSFMIAVLSAQWHSVDCLLCRLCYRCPAVSLMTFPQPYIRLSCSPSRKSIARTILAKIPGFVSAMTSLLWMVNIRL